jgi:4-hydroxy-4-methyl-2-oxoglutarate aldolase
VIIASNFSTLIKTQPNNMSTNLNADIEAYKKEVGMMKLEKLIAERESISTKEFPVPVKELLQRYEQLYTGAISDVLREFALRDSPSP